MIQKVFALVACTLLHIAKLLRITYNEINIIVYYGLVPLTWCVMLDCILCTFAFTPAWLSVCLATYLVHRKDFSLWCDRFFMQSANFLNSFHFLGWNYCKASVIICVVIPILIYLVLGMFLIIK